MMHYQCNYNDSTGTTGMYTPDSSHSTRIAKVIATSLKASVTIPKNFLIDGNTDWGFGNDYHRLCYLEASQ